jgi:HAD superfamily hydrolase (TIGR01490 family)
MGRIAALFDMDNTLLDTNSGRVYGRFLYREGLIGRWALAKVAWWSILGKLGMLDMNKLIPSLLSSVAGGDEQEMWRQNERCFVEDVIPHVTERGKQRVAEHQAQGHLVAIVSASTQFVVRPMAAHLGIEGQYVCTQVETRAGHLTGRVVPPVCYGPGKVVWARRFAEEHDVDLSASYCYTDSISDLPLLEVVGHPVAVNPDHRLRRLANERDWLTEMFY